MIRLSATINIEGNNHEIDRNLINIRFSGQDRSDSSLPSWGIKSNSGSLEMYDIDESITKAYEKGLLEKSLIDIYLNVGERKEQIGRFNVVGANRNKQTLKTTIEFQDTLVSWQDKKMPQYCEFSASVSPTIQSILSKLLTIANISVLYSNDKTAERARSLYINHAILEAGSFWAQMEKICEVGAFYIYCDEMGNARIHYSGDT